MKPRKPFSLLVKPASADCNLRCTYCFYLDKASLYPSTNTHRMPTEVLESMISSFFAVDQPCYSIGWQGGEPTLMGIEFFRKVVELEERYARRGALIANGLQTNGTIMNDELARFLADHKFLVGISIDGPADVHDLYRVRADGSGSHSSVLSGIECLKRNRVEFNGLVLVNSSNVTRPHEIYRYLCDLGINHHQYIPCVEFDRKGNLLPHAITGEQWGEFLCSIFDEWVGKDVRRVSVRDFDSVIRFMVDQTYPTCTSSGSCDHYFVVEHNGDVYPCDFFVEPDKRLGNVLSDSFLTLQQSRLYSEFSTAKACWSDVCSSCKYLVFCSGDCPKHRVRDIHSRAAISWLCSGWKRFFDHSIRDFERIALSLINSRNTVNGHTLARRFDSVPYPDLGRNDPCFCGSGRKYKKCHGAYN